MTAIDVPTVRLNDGTSIPQFGFGVFQVPPEDTAGVVGQALDAGYRHIDTAQMYGNEAGVGAAIAASGLDRDDLYITTKLNNNNHRPDDAKRSLAESLRLLGLDQVDLFLIHWPLPMHYDGDFVSTWQTLVELRDEGLTRSVGVSNFQPDHLQRIVDATGVAPAVNQVEVQPYFGNEAVRSANARHGVVTEAWSPIAQGRVLGDPVLTEIADRVGATPAQATLAWHLERGDVVFPKTTHADRMRENLAALDVTLTDDDVAAISALDRGEAGRNGPNPDTFDVIPS